MDKGRYVYPGKYAIDKNLAVTGLTYEEAFRQEKGENNE